VWYKDDQIYNIDQNLIKVQKRVKLQERDQPLMFYLWLKLKILVKIRPKIP